MNENGDSGSPPGRVREVYRPGTPGYWTQAAWEEDYPWLLQGVTGSMTGPEGEPADFRVFSDPTDTGSPEAWFRFSLAMGFEVAVLSRQVHGCRVRVHRTTPREESLRGMVGEWPAPEADGHLTSETGALLGVTIADCVPVFMVAPAEGAVGLLHAGWRGVGAGILEEGVSLMAREYDVAPGSIRIHLGPSICGECYEVGREVHAGLGLSDPGRPGPVDLRAVLASRARSLGVRGEALSVSTWCTRCGGSPFFSHRGGDSGRQLAFLGIRSRGDRRNGERTGGS